MADSPSDQLIKVTVKTPKDTHTFEIKPDSTVLEVNIINNKYVCIVNVL